MTENILLLISDSCPPDWVKELTANLEKKTGFIVQTRYISDHLPLPQRIPGRWKKGKYGPAGNRTLIETEKHTFPADIPPPCFILDFCGMRMNQSINNDLPVFRCSLFDEARGHLHALLLRAIAGNRPTIDVNIRLHQGNQQPRLIKHGCFKTVIYDYRKTLDIILENLLVLIPSAVQQYHLTGEEFSAKDMTGTTNWQSLADACRKTENRHRLLHRARLIFTSETWNTGFIRFPIEKVALQKKIRWEVEWDRELQAGLFRADPFGIEEDGQRILIYEKYSSKTGRLIVEQNGKSTEPIPEPGVHRSYPYLFRYNGNWYCLPEQKASNKISLYRLEMNSGKLIHTCDILDNMEAADPSMILLNDRWWLFFTDTEHKGADLRLCIYHAPRPEGPWTPHALNPVKTDITSARPAGHLFVHDGIAYRPAQDSSLTYGGSIRIHRIDMLTPEAYEESEVNQLLPGQLSGPYKSGWHTISICGKGCLVDGKRSFTDPLKMFRKTRLKS